MKIDLRAHLKNLNYFKDVYLLKHSDFYWGIETSGAISIIGKMHLPLIRFRGGAKFGKHPENSFWLNIIEVISLQIGYFY